MSGVLVLIFVSLALGVIGLLAFLWSMKDGQYDDMQGAAERILYDDDRPITRSAKVDEKSEEQAGTRSNSQRTVDDRT